MYLHTYTEPMMIFIIEKEDRYLQNLIDDQPSKSYRDVNKAVIKLFKR